MRHRIALPVIACSVAIGLAGCTTQQEQNTLTGVSLACSALGVGSQIAVNVAVQSATQGAAPTAAQTISQEVGAGVSAACPLLVSGVQTAVNQITSEGQTATVTVTTTTPKGARRSVRFKATKVNGVMVYTIPPNPLGFFGL